MKTPPSNRGGRNGGGGDGTDAELLAFRGDRLVVALLDHLDVLDQKTKWGWEDGAENGGGETADNNERDSPSGETNGRESRKLPVGQKFATYFDTMIGNIDEFRFQLPTLATRVHGLLTLSSALTVEGDSFCLAIV